MRLITFASRWKEKLQPSSIRSGKEISKIIAIESKKSGNKFLTQKLNGSSISRQKEIFSNANEMFDGKQGKETFKGFSERHKTPSSKNIKFLGKAKKFIGKNKLGLGVAGVVSLGAIGYGAMRKIRSDKNKKRGGYFK